MRRRLGPTARDRLSMARMEIEGDEAPGTWRRQRKSSESPLLCVSVSHSYSSVSLPPSPLPAPLPVSATSLFSLCLSLSILCLSVCLGLLHPQGQMMSSAFPLL